MRPIDADALFKAVNRLFYSAFDVGSKDSENGRFRRGYNVAITDACEAITAVPTLSPDDVRCVGEWKTYVLDGVMGDRPTVLACSNCRRVSTVKTPYCAQCGARMKGAKDGTTD